jgi:GntR family transcriptional regulator
MDARLSINVDSKAGQTPSEQIAAQVRFAIAAGRLRAGDRLPSVRQLALDALVNPNTVAKVWRELERSGVLECRAGDGVFVANGATQRCCASRDAELAAELERWVGEALSAGLTRSDLETWFERTLARGQGSRRIGAAR